ncbi:hypothetical protein KC669_05065 [Candidatus Dojkabacteria bacterium]|uniref:DNA-(apurinic or apyrimidinic site) lyase n=1 Tax=Candidatus Dojkabacteria bacterium TaxID=2099670 RepID=A0A955LBY5_9BACT|nr:hypothetical protein [Candidatus Dojkabacteria bacterium]
MNKFNYFHLDITKTLDSGQTFLWEKEFTNKYIGHFIDKIIILQNVNNYWFWQTYPNNNDFEFISKYFNPDYKLTNKLLSSDAILNESFKRFKGIHILKQPLEETMISFVLATNKNINAIKKSLNKLMEMQNIKITTEFGSYYLFPSSDFLSSLDEEDIAKSGTGYRTTNLKQLSKRLAEGFNIPNNLSYSEAKEILMSFRGIGNKVADCILTFSLGYKNVTPIDRWSERVITDLYKSKLPKKYEEKLNWYTSRFGNDTAIAGQILFEHIRNL